MKNGLGLLMVACVIFTAAFACNMSTANISSFIVSKDKEGSKESTNFVGGDIIYGRAQIANNGGKVKVKIYITVEDAKGQNKGDLIKNSDVSVDIDGDSAATYTTPIPESVKGGKYNVVADMINDSGEKKDSKSITINVADSSE